MGYHGKLDEKIRAQMLRKQGFSYREILEKIHVSKDTLSRWCRDIKLSKKQMLRLYKKKLSGGLKGSIIGAKKQQQTRLKNMQKLMDKGINEVGKLSKRERFLVGIALYVSEGTKADRRCQFTNSDPHLIKFMSKWFVEFCQVDKSKIRGAIWLHEGLDEKKAKKFWSKISSIPLNKFHKTYIAKNKKYSNKIRKNLHSYGIFSIRFSSAKVHRRIMGWIAGILGES